LSKKTKFDSNAETPEFGQKMYPDIHMEKAPAPSQHWLMNLLVWHTYVDTPGVTPSRVGLIDALQGCIEAVSANA